MLCVQPCTRALQWRGLPLLQLICKWIGLTCRPPAAAMWRRPGAPKRSCHHLCSALPLQCRYSNCWAHETHGALSAYLRCPNGCRYLDYVEAKGDVGMTVRMFERCLVACANYPGRLQLPSFCRARPCARYCAQLPSYPCCVHLFSCMSSKGTSELSASFSPGYMAGEAGKFIAIYSHSMC